MTHDYKRNGTTTLFAALNVLDGRVVGCNMQRHRHQEFIRFLNIIEHDVPAGKIVHVILDNYATHEHPKVKQWLRRHPRWTFHFTPTSSSFAQCRGGLFRQAHHETAPQTVGVFHSIVDLQAAINRFIEETNEAFDPKPLRLDQGPRQNHRRRQTMGTKLLDSIH